MSDQKKEEKSPPPLQMTKRGMELTTVESAYRFAQYVLASGMAPAQYKRPEQVIIAVQRGAEIGLPPLQALDSIAVINGRPTLYGDALPALGWGSGVLDEMDECFEGEGDNLTAVCRTKRKGSGRWCETRFSVQDAKAANLWGKSGPWKNYPKRMLQMRARSWNFRDNLADVLRGVGISEEVRDFQPPAAAIEADTVDLATFGQSDTIVEAEPVESEPELTLEEQAARDEAERSAEFSLERE